MNPYRRFVDNTVTISILVSFVVALQPQAATAQQTKPAAGSGFSFAAYGDSRPMMYLPPKDGQPDLVNLAVPNPLPLSHIPGQPADSLRHTIRVA